MNTEPRTPITFDGANSAKRSAYLLSISGPLEKVLLLGSARFIQDGVAIHRTGDELRSLYFLKTGFAKRLLHREDGREQVLGFPLNGELLGLEAIGGEYHSSTVQALGPCHVVEIPFRLMEVLMAQDPDVAKTVYRLIAAALREDYGWLAALGLLNAEERVAAFLLNLSRRYAERGYSGTKFLLRMTRAEIGGFLGLSLETVSRILSQLQRDRVLSVDRREIGILNMSALLAVGTNRPLN